MAKHSKDILDEVAALYEINEIDNEKDLRAFIKGETRDELLSAAEWRINALRPKQGEQIGPITQRTDDFKTGVEGTKSLTMESIVGPIDEAAAKKADEDYRASIEAEKARAAGTFVSKHVTIEDVLKNKA
ncbi:MAG: hypothetical protein OEW15_18955 [Nitrospirota bacterium]|nr:hypothetical protein [Nitrospirota bacterium]